MFAVAGAIPYGIEVLAFQDSRGDAQAMKTALLPIVLASACSVPLGSAYAPKSSVDFALHEASYDLLGRVAATACGTSDYVDAHVNRSTDKWHGLYRYLYETAKVQALDSKPDADMLLFVRAMEKVNNGQYCVTINGLAVRVTSLRAVAAAGAAPTTGKRTLLPIGD